MLSRKKPSIISLEFRTCDVGEFYWVFTTLFSQAFRDPFSSTEVIRYNNWPFV